MRLDRLRTGLLAGPMPTEGTLTDLRPSVPAGAPPTLQTDRAVGPLGQHDLKMVEAIAQLFGKPVQDIPDTVARGNVLLDMKSHGDVPTIGPLPQYPELSDLAQGKSFGRMYSEKDDSADLPTRPTGPPSEVPEGMVAEPPLRKLRSRDGGFLR